jgi:hypothetical protein
MMGLGFIHLGFLAAGAAVTVPILIHLDPPSPLTPLPGGARGTWRGELGAETPVFSVPLAPMERGVRGEGAGPARESRPYARHAYPSAIDTAITRSERSDFYDHECN